MTSYKHCTCLLLFGYLWQRIFTNKCYLTEVHDNDETDTRSYFRKNVQNKHANYKMIKDSTLTFVSITNMKVNSLKRIPKRKWGDEIEIKLFFFINVTRKNNDFHYLKSDANILIPNLTLDPNYRTLSKLFLSWNEK